MYRVERKIARGRLAEEKFDSFEKAKRFAWANIQKPEVQKVEIWMGGLFQARISKEGYI